MTNVKRLKNNDNEWQEFMFCFVFFKEILIKKSKPKERQPKQPKEQPPPKQRQHKQQQTRQHKQQPTQPIKPSRSPRFQRSLNTPIRFNHINLGRPIQPTALSYSQSRRKSTRRRKNRSRRRRKRWMWRTTILSCKSCKKSNSTSATNSFLSCAKKRE